MCLLLALLCAIMRLAIGNHRYNGVAILPFAGIAWSLLGAAQNFLPASVTSRPLRGDAPTVDLVLGYRKSNQSPILKLLLSRLDELVARASSKTDKTRDAC